MHGGRGPGFEDPPPPFFPLSSLVYVWIPKLHKEGNTFLAQVLLHALKDRPPGGGGVTCWETCPDVCVEK